MKIEDGRTYWDEKRIVHLNIIPLLAFTRPLDYIRYSFLSTQRLTISIFISPIPPLIIRKTTTENIIDPTTMLGYNFPQSTFRFGSEAVNREYSILSNMLSAATPSSDAIPAPQVSFADMEMVESNPWHSSPPMASTQS